MGKQHARIAHFETLFLEIEKNEDNMKTTRRQSAMLNYTVLAVSVLLLFQNCSSPKFDFAATLPGPGTNNQILADGTALDEFTQNPPQSNNKVDILFVVNSSASLQAVISSVTQGIGSFISQLPGDSSFQISVIPSHSPRATATSGNLFGAGGLPVLSSSALSFAAMQSALSNTLTHLPDVSVGGEGAEEEGLASMFTAIEKNHLTHNRDLGFFRADASLAVVYIANEADVCGEPETDPHTDSDWTEARVTAALDCASHAINANSVLAGLRSIQGSRPLLVSGILYPDIGQKAGTHEKEFGWGYIETVMAANGCTNPMTCPAIIDMNLDSVGVASGLANIGNLMKQKLNFEYDFLLSHKAAQASCIHVRVDGQDSTFTYNAISNSVHIDHPGQIGSKISINYCI